MNTKIVFPDVRFLKILGIRIRAVILSELDFEFLTRFLSWMISVMDSSDSGSSSSAGPSKRKVLVLNPSLNW